MKQERERERALKTNLNNFPFFFSICNLADSPYHDVSGLPNPYNMEHMEQDEVLPPQQHMSLSYDDSFEGEYSTTPNARNRRVIREIIV